MSANPQFENRPTPRMHREYASPCPPRSLHRRLAVILSNIEGRCGRYPSVNKFKYYGGRGIKNFLTLDDLRRLWERDGAERMAKPSIDRKDTAGHYTFENCRFIEFADNRKGADLRRTCTNCGVKARGIDGGLCLTCHPAPQCIRCHGPLGTVAYKNRICDNCRFMTRPCTWCAKSITRDMGANGGFRRNKQWFCSKREQGLWLGTTHGGHRKNGAAQEATN